MPAETARTPRYAGRRRRNAIAMGLAVAATALGLGWLVLILGALVWVGIYVRDAALRKLIPLRR